MILPMRHRILLVGCVCALLGCSADVTVETLSGPGQGDSPSDTSGSGDVYGPSDVSGPNDAIPFGSACPGDGIVDDAFAYDVTDRTSLDALTGCVESPGSLYITDTTDITTLQPLASLRLVGGEVRIRANSPAMWPSKATTRVVPVHDVEAVSVRLPEHEALRSISQRDAHRPRSSRDIPASGSRASSHSLGTWASARAAMMPPTIAQVVSRSPNPETVVQSASW